jgi:hypothetical protein
LAPEAGVSYIDLARARGLRRERRGAIIIAG